MLLAILLSVLWSRPPKSSAQIGSSVRRVNMPYLGSGPPVEYFEPAVFWFGDVTPTINNADVRMWYYDTYLKLTVHIIDRRVWQDPTPSVATLEEWDAVTLLLDMDGNQGDAPGNNSFRLVTQLGASETDTGRQTAYRGNGSAWVPASVPFTAEGIFRGNWYNDDIDDKGWQLTVVIPFTSFGLSGPPPTGTIWGLGVVVHDRDDASGSAIPDQIWPEQMLPTVPASWGQLHFGRAQFNPPIAIPTGSTTIRQGVNGVTVPDAHVGGNFTCGDGLDHWTEWGVTNYAGSTQINIQNQWDISDYPCFSKYFVTFPLDSIPAGQPVVSAKLLMTMFGNAGGGPWGIPPDSFIQVLTVAEEWNEATLTWNNAPLALENITGTWVKPTQTSEQREYYFDVSKAIIEAHQLGQPLRLALYSADGERHSGKYFFSSDSNDWNGTVRPTLQVFWGNGCDDPGTNCTSYYLPSVWR
jgi:hypothetical protein